MVVRLPEFESGSPAWQAQEREKNLVFFCEQSLDWDSFKKWLDAKYSKSWSADVFRMAKKHSALLNGNLRELDSLSKSNRSNALKALIALSRYLGCYRQFKSRISDYGLKWETQNSMEAFLRIMNTKTDLMDWVGRCLTSLDESESTFIRFAMVSGLRKGEAINSFNLIVDLSQKGIILGYLNAESGALEHFRFEKTFIRGSKNVFFSFLPPDLIEWVAKCRPISYPKLRKDLKKHGLNIRINELRDNYATFMIHHGLIREEVDLLQGRVGRSIFMRHYFSPAINDLKDRVLRACSELEGEFLKASSQGTTPIAPLID